ncbi:MAG: hypothetical protein HON23_02265 [Rickettsiales bacterium]|nr:hypothetical protein [Rickettsiales bacterium]
MTISKEEVMLLPGYAKPQKVKVISTTEEVWIYDKKGFVWAGFVPLVIIPIPIIFPVGKKYEYIFFEDNIVRERKENYSGYVSGTCGALFTGAEYGCEITYNEEHLFKFTLN